MDTPSQNDGVSPNNGEEYEENGFGGLEELKSEDMIENNMSPIQIDASAGASKDSVENTPATSSTDGTPSVSKQTRRRWSITNLISNKYTSKPSKRHASMQVPRKNSFSLPANSTNESETSLLSDSFMNKLNKYTVSQSGKFSFVEFVAFCKTEIDHSLDKKSILAVWRYFGAKTETVELSLEHMNNVYQEKVHAMRSQSSQQSGQSQQASSRHNKSRASRGSISSKSSSHKKSRSHDILRQASFNFDFGFASQKSTGDIDADLQFEPNLNIDTSRGVFILEIFISNDRTSKSAHGALTYQEFKDSVLLIYHNLHDINYENFDLDCLNCFNIIKSKKDDLFHYKRHIGALQDEIDNYTLVEFKSNYTVFLNFLLLVYATKYQTLNHSGALDIANIRRNKASGAGSSASDASGAAQDAADGNAGARGGSEGAGMISEEIVSIDKDTRELMQEIGNLKNIDPNLKIILNDSISDMQSKLEGCLKTVAVVENERVTLQMKCDEMEKQLNYSNAVDSEKMKDLDYYKQECEMLRNELNLSESDCTSLKHYKSENESLKKDFSELIDRYHTLISENRLLAKQLKLYSSYEEERHAMKDTIQQLMDQLEDSQKDCRMLSKGVKSLQSENEMLLMKMNSMVEEHNGNSNAFVPVKAEPNEGEMNGINGMNEMMNGVMEHLNGHGNNGNDSPRAQVIPRFKSMRSNNINGAEGDKDLEAHNLDEIGYNLYCNEKDRESDETDNTISELSGGGEHIGIDVNGVHRRRNNDAVYEMIEQMQNEMMSNFTKSHKYIETLKKEMNDLKESVSKHMSGSYIGSIKLVPS